MAGENRGVTPEPGWGIGRKVVLFSAGALAVVVLFLLLLCQVAGIHSMSDVAAYRGMRRQHFPPIWKALALRRIRKGQSVESLVKKHPPRYREDAGAYTGLDYCWRGLGAPELTLLAKNGKLIAAGASSRKWRHVFFEAPEKGESFARASMRFKQRKELETGAYRIHHAITNNQDVFLSDRVKRRRAPGPPPEFKKIMEQLKKSYGSTYRQGFPSTHKELAVELTEVLSGPLAPGTILTFPKGKCQDAHLDEPETVFLALPGRDAISYMTVPKAALDWYQSLTPEQIEKLEARWSGKLAKHPK